MVCLHFSVTHRSAATPVAPPASNHRASPLWTAGPGFSKAVTQIPHSLTKRAVKTVVWVVISQVRAIITDISILDRQLQPDTNYSIQKEAPSQVRVIVLKWFSPGRSRQKVLTEPCWLYLTGRQFEGLIYTKPSADMTFSRSLPKYPAGHLWRAVHGCVRWDWRCSHLAHNLAFWDPVCCLKGLWNVEQIPSALSAWARSPLAGLKSQGPARELTEFHMEARNRGTSCLSLTACPTPALICRRPVHSLLLLVCQVVRACLKSGPCMFCRVPVRSLFCLTSGAAECVSFTAEMICERIN